MNSPGPAPVRDRWQRRVRHVDLRPRLPAVHQPILVCVGRYDPQTPCAGNAALAAALPHAQVVVFEHSGHYPFVEERRRFSQVAARFLEVAPTPEQPAAGPGAKGPADRPSLA